MLFTEEFKIVRDSSDTWFNPLLSYDTRLFVDPFLIFQTANPQFKHGHDKMVRHFNNVFELIAKSSGNTNSIHYRRALALLLFPEVDEICLGFSKDTTKGQGSGHGFSKLIANAIWISIQAGVKQITHFEELSIFNEGIGADRISDMTANLLKPELIAYTQQICRKFDVGVYRQQIRNSVYNEDLHHWSDTRVALPYNKYIRRPILLVPEEFLSALPAINHEDYLDYVYEQENQIIRENLSYRIKSKVNKADVVALARKHIHSVERYLKYKEERGAKPYDLQKDSKGLYSWYEKGQSFALSHLLSISPPSGEEEFLAKIDKIVQTFKHYVEHERGYLLLYDDSGHPMSEKAVQRLFWGVTIHYCRANNIDCSSETDSGSGPVDFKFSNGYQSRLLLEVKLASHTRLWNGLTLQLPQYLETENIKNGIFLIIAYNKQDLLKVSRKLARKIAEVSERTRSNIRCVVIDASKKLPASKL